jgi:hypothetical protein
MSGDAGVEHARVLLKMKMDVQLGRPLRCPDFN